MFVAIHGVCGASFWPILCNVDMKWRGDGDANILVPQAMAGILFCPLGRNIQSGMPKKMNSIVSEKLLFSHTVLTGNFRAPKRLYKHFTTSTLIWILFLIKSPENWQALPIPWFITYWVVPTRSLGFNTSLYDLTVSSIEHLQSTPLLLQHRITPIFEALAIQEGLNPSIPCTRKEIWVVER